MLLDFAILAASRMLAEVNPGGNPSLVVDLLNLQWWQALLAILGVLGLSPAPWLLGLAANRIGFTAPMRADFKRQMDDMAEAHKRELAGKDAYYGALLTGKDERYADLQKTNDANSKAVVKERDRADVVTDAAFEVVEALRANTHVIASIRELAEETPEGGS